VVGGTEALAGGERQDAVGSSQHMMAIRDGAFRGSEARECLRCCGSWTRSVANPLSVGRLPRGSSGWRLPSANGFERRPAVVSGAAWRRKPIGSRCTSRMAPRERSFGSGIPLTTTPRLEWERLGCVALAAIHATDLGADIPSAVRRPHYVAGWRLWDVEADARLEAATAAIETLQRSLPRDREVFCHNDFHSGNILFDGRVLSGVVDWS
jgi:hypothetical protein